MTLWKRAGSRVAGRRVGAIDRTMTMSGAVIGAPILCGHAVMVAFRAHGAVASARRGSWWGSLSTREARCGAKVGIPRFVSRVSCRASFVLIMLGLIEGMARDAFLTGHGVGPIDPRRTGRAPDADPAWGWEGAS